MMNGVCVKSAKYLAGDASFGNTSRKRVVNSPENVNGEPRINWNRK